LFGFIGLSLVKAQTIYLENFNSPTYNTGNLSSQNSWGNFLDGSSRIFSNTQANSGLVSASQFAGNSSVLSGTSSGTGATKTVSLELGNVTAASFSVDLFRSGASPTYGAGFGSSSGAGRFEGVSILQNSSNIQFRSGVASGANAIFMTDVNGNSINTSNNCWTRVTFNLDFTNNVITSAYIQNLSSGSTSTQIYFGANTPTMAYTIDESTWDRIALRTGYSGANEVGIDNITLTATSVIPEPSSFASIAGLMTAGFALMRRRRFSS
jgi:hypothetical protein